MRAAAAEMPAEHAILGLLALSQGGSHGYDLARHFGADAPLGAVLHLEPGMLYHHLKKLERAGWVEASTEQPGTRPPRRVYSLTPAGAAELQRWLREPVSRTRDIRLDFLVKLYLARRLEPEVAAELVAGQRERAGALRTSLQAQLDGLGDSSGGEEAAFLRDVLELRLAQTDAAVAWLTRIDVETR